MMTRCVAIHPESPTEGAAWHCTCVKSYLHSGQHQCGCGFVWGNADDASRRLHPDSGGDEEQLHKLTQARDLLTAS